MPNLTDKEMLQMALRIYDVHEMDWLPISTLHEEILAFYEDEDPPDVTVQRLSRYLRENDQMPEAREYGDKTPRGYTRHNFAVLLQEDEVKEEASQQEAHGHTTQTCADRVLSFISSQDADWAAKIDAVKQEFGWTSQQVLVSFSSYVLENNLHVAMSLHPAVTGENIKLEKATCPICKSIYKPSYPGQATCTENSECGRTYHKKRREAEQLAELGVYGG